MLTTSPSRQNFWHWFKLNKILTPLTVGVTLLTALGIAMETKPSLAQSQHYDGHTYRRTISIPRRIRSTNSHHHSNSPYYHDRHNRRVVNHGHYNSNSPYYHDRHDRRVVDHGHYHPHSPHYHDRHNRRVVDHDYYHSNSPYYHDRHNRVRKKFPHSPRYNRRRHGGSQLIFDSPGLTIHLRR